MDKPRYEVDITVVTRYLPEQSGAERGQHAWTYTVRMRNAGSVPAQLISRHWVITDANGDVEEVRGLGVVGQQPLLAPGETFEYTSGTAISTPTGSMHGEYYFTAEDGTQFSAPIPMFTLAAPHALH
ncbi:Co2+/Mg2+ efflux protein ApaG [Derxia gummosa]|uniref:Protein ApaG n=1 Tax=Derxia gummosa DSM 723 TaxID=1121388 RepID=A0A8B6X5L3_9BURK|nr:Co2+/Mg2+ efflux protein ApaG [Derxia gummosa]